VAERQADFVAALNASLLNGSLHSALAYAGISVNDSSLLGAVAVGNSLTCSLALVFDRAADDDAAAQAAAWLSSTGAAAHNSTSDAPTCTNVMASSLAAALANVSGWSTAGVSLTGLQQLSSGWSASFSVASAAQARCSFWDTEALAYSTAGCVSMPSPSPPSHTLSWLNITTPSDVVLPLAWNISGPLIDGGACRQRLMDCSTNATALQKIRLLDTSTPGSEHPPAYIGSDAMLCVEVSPAPAAGSATQAALVAIMAAGLNVSKAAVSLVINASAALCVTTLGGADYVSLLASLSPTLAPPLHAALKAVAPSANFSAAYALALIYPSSSKIYPNPGAPLAVPAVTCPAASACGGPAPVLRIFYGSSCALLDGGNELGCAWNAELQSFVGAGCVSQSDATQCQCRHLTDFASASAPSLPTCSLSDMLSLNPADIVSKLTMLFALVISLFGVMTLGAVFGMVSDGRERQRLIAKLQDDDAGFRETDDGAWLWRFSLDGGKDDGCPAGPAVRICAIIGVPFARIRVAIPDDMATWTSGAALGGNNAALSVSELEGTLHSKSRRLTDFMRSGIDDNESPPAFTPRSMSLLTASSVHAVDDTPVTPFSHAIHAPHAPLDEFLGTALVLACLHAQLLMPLERVKALSAAARRHFAGVHTLAGRDWDFVKDTFTSAFDGNLNQRERWLFTARLIKLVLCQTPDGAFDASSSVAFAVLARQNAEVETILNKTTLSRRLYMHMERWMSSVGLIEDVGVASQPALPGGVRKAAEPAELTALRSSEVTDCPLTFSVLAFHESLPPALADLAPEAQALRVWTTMCCVASMQCWRVSWLWGSGYLYPRVSRTVVDAAREWVERRAAAHPALARALADKSVFKEAKRVSGLWALAWQQRVHATRQADALTSSMWRDHAERIGSKVLYAVSNKHGTFKCFLQSAGVERRWQSFMLVMTMVMSTLLTNIWMFYAKR